VRGIFFFFFLFFNPKKKKKRKMEYTKQFVSLWTTVMNATTFVAPSPAPEKVAMPSTIELEPLQIGIIAITIVVIAITAFARMFSMVQGAIWVIARYVWDIIKFSIKIYLCVSIMNPIIGIFFNTFIRPVLNWTALKLYHLAGK
jgi:hypothetical protein